MSRRCLSVWALTFTFLCSVGVLLAKPNPSTRPDQKAEPKKTDKTAFKPVEINNELTVNDKNDPQRNHPAKEYTIKLSKDRTYLIDLVSKDFDSYLRLLDKNGSQLAQDDDGGGGLNARIIFAAPSDAEYKIVATSFNGQVGKFNLQVREFKLGTEGKPRTVGKDGLNINDQIGNNDKSPINKLGKVYSVQLKAGQKYAIDLQSQAIDSYFYLYDGKGKLLARDDDSGGNLNSRIVFQPTQDGVYHLLATSLSGNQTGEINLRVNPE